MLNAWTKHEVKRYITARLADEATRREVAPVSTDITDWFAGLVAGLHAEHNQRLGETLGKLLEWLSAGSVPSLEVPTGVVSFSVGSVKRHQVAAGEMLTAKGCFNELRLAETVEVEPGLAISALLVHSRSVGVCAPGVPDLEDVGPPTRYGLDNHPHPTIYLRLTSPNPGGPLRPTFHLRAPASVLAAMLASPWSTRTRDRWTPVEHVETASSNPADEHRGPLLESVSYSGTPGWVSSVWTLPEVYFENDVELPSGLLEALEKGGSKPSASTTYETWMRIPLFGVARETASLGSLACNVGIVEAARELDFQITPAEDGLAIRIPGLIRTLSVARALDPDALQRIGGRAAAEFVHFTEAAQLTGASRGPGRSRGYIISGDVLILCYDDIAQAEGALDEPVRIFCTVFPNQGTEGANASEVVAFQEQPSADIQVASVAPAFRETPVDRLSGSTREGRTNRQLGSFDGTHWLQSTLVGHGRAVTASDIRTLVIGAFPGVQDVKIQAALGRNAEGSLQSILRVRCQLKHPEEFLADRTILAKRIEQFLFERASPHLGIHVELE